MRGERAWGDGSASGMHKDGPTQGWGGQGTRGAHVEHGVHARDLGRVEAERLVERRRALPSRKAGMQCAARCRLGGVKALGVAAQSGGPDSRLGTRGTRGAHQEHGGHGRDLGRVEAERLVERRRALPSRKAGMRRAVRGRGRATAAHAACAGMARLKAVGARARAERT